MAGSWHPLINQPPFQTSTMILLTDGRVMVQEEATQHWHALTPSDSGSYVGGTWSTLADMSFMRRYYSSGTLKDGRVILIGGEQSGDIPDTNKGEIYDPASDTWSPIPSPPGWAQVGDASCCVLPDGRFMIGALASGACMIYDPETNSWSPAATKSVRSNEETWVLLPDETIVTPQCWPPYRSERYSISSNAWKSAGALPAAIVDPVMHEIGPGMLMYNGDVIFFGAANVRGRGKTVIYTPPATPGGIGAWIAGPDIPPLAKHTIVCNDCPASLLPNGKVLFAAAPFKNDDWGSPIYVFEYDPFTNSITPAPTPPNNAADLYWSRFMLLPTGHVLFSPSSNHVQCYTPDGAPEEAWRPTVSAVVPDCDPCLDGAYQLQGTQLNGLSQANIYGDDCSPATNYPLVRLRAPQTGKILYCRTYGFSTMGVATGSRPQSCRFSTANVPFGHYELCVIANGISSHCVSFCHRRHGRRCCCDTTRKMDSCCGGAREGCCCQAGDADRHVITELKGQIRGLQNGISRVSSLFGSKGPVRQPKEKASEEKSRTGRAKKPKQ